MGQLDIINGYEPQNITPQGAYSNPLSYYQFIPATTYANPEHFGYAGVPGPFTVAGLSEVTGTEFLQPLKQWPLANTQIVSVPARPVDKGTYDAYLQNSTGVYLQNAQTGIVHQYSGAAPTTGIYTGYYTNSGEYENC